MAETRRQELFNAGANGHARVGLRDGPRGDGLKGSPPLLAARWHGQHTVPMIPLPLSKTCLGRRTDWQLPYSPPFLMQVIREGHAPAFSCILVWQMKTAPLQRYVSSWTPAARAWRGKMKIKAWLCGRRGPRHDPA